MSRKRNHDARGDSMHFDQVVSHLQAVVCGLLLPALFLFRL